MEQHDYLSLLEKYFNKKTSPEENKILISWISRPGIREEFDQLCKQIWKDASVEIDQTIADDMWNHLQKKLNKTIALPPRIKKKSTYYKIAATILLPIFIGLGAYYLANHQNETSQELFAIEVDYGQKANISLPDGTKVWLNSATQLTYDANYNKKDRKIHLNGEAYFEVAKNKKKRFIVNCNELNIEALGTKFDVKGYKDDACVTTLLVEGSVRVGNESNSTLLNVGEKVTYHKENGTLTKSPISDMREVDFWRKNMLIFNSASMAEIATTIERMYGVKVVFDSEKTKKTLFTGTIRNSSLHNVFYIISLTYPLTYKLDGDTVRISGAN